MTEVLFIVIVFIVAYVIYVIVWNKKQHPLPQSIRQSLKSQRQVIL